MIKHPDFLYGDLDDYDFITEMLKIKSKYYENRTKELERAIYIHKMNIPDLSAPNDEALWKIINE